MKGTFTKDLMIMAALLLVLSAVTYCTRPQDPDAASFTIIYSNDMLGEVEPCG
ncbi:MAG: hypothetical protein JW885_15535 [Deltaproteobacteria bacterium]|nr:hypothetical protein [Candidatus Zymogenaceae bacterium]